MYATLTAFTDPLFRSMADGLQGLERAPGPSRRSPPASSDIDAAFWQACHGGQRRMAEYLLAQGANINFIPKYAEQTALQAAGGTDTQRQILADWLKERGAAEG